MPTTSPPLIFIRLLLVLLVATSSALANNFVDASSRIDAIIRIDLKKHGLQPTPVASDVQFVRRVYLDVIGRIPTDKGYRFYVDSLDITDESNLSCGKIK